MVGPMSQKVRKSQLGRRKKHENSERQKRPGDVQKRGEGEKSKAATPKIVKGSLTKKWCPQ